MKTRALFGTAAAAVACVVLIGIQPVTSPAQQKEPKAAAPTKWEYKQVENPNNAALAKLGEEGWEIVTVLGGQPYVTETTSRQSESLVGNFAGKTITALVTGTKNTSAYGKLIYVF